MGKRRVGPRAVGASSVFIRIDRTGNEMEPMHGVSSKLRWALIRLAEFRGSVLVESVPYDGTETTVRNGSTVAYTYSDWYRIPIPEGKTFLDVQRICWGEGLPKQCGPYDRCGRGHVIPGAVGSGVVKFRNARATDPMVKQQEKEHDFVLMVYYVLPGGMDELRNLPAVRADYYPEEESRWEWGANLWIKLMKAFPMFPKLFAHALKLFDFGEIEAGKLVHLLNWIRSFNGRELAVKNDTRLNVLRAFSSNVDYLTRLKREVALGIASVPPGMTAEGIPPALAAAERSLADEVARLTKQGIAF